MLLLLIRTASVLTPQPHHVELFGSIVLLAVAVSEWPVSRYCRRVPGKLRADRHMLPSRLVLARRCVHAVSGLAAICTMFMFAGA